MKQNMTIIFIFFMMILQSCTITTTTTQKITVKGLIVDKNDIPLAGVNVKFTKLDGNPDADIEYFEDTTTDINGSYQIEYIGNLIIESSSSGGAENAVEYINKVEVKYTLTDYLPESLSFNIEKDNIASGDDITYTKIHNLKMLR